jgi:hypothetical protein
MPAQVPIAAVACLCAIWGCLALWHRLPVAAPWRGVAAAALAGLALAGLAVMVVAGQPIGLLPFAFVFAVLLVWWTTLRPPAQGDWAPDVARQVTGHVDGNMVTLTDVRAFEWRSKTDFDPVWITRAYDLTTLQSLDLFLCYWGNPHITHVVTSFGFANGEYLAWSVEVRRRRGGRFSPVADLFKANPLVLVAGEERDVIGVRSNIRGEDVRLYRMQGHPGVMGPLLLEYVDDANRLAKRPVYFNSLTTNCTTTVIKMMRAAGGRLPFDWHLIVNGYLPAYAYKRGALGRDRPLEEIIAAAAIRDRALAAGLGPDFSQRIRQ